MTWHAPLKRGLEKVREKPEPTRWALVFAISSVTAAVLFAVWIKRLPGQISFITKEAKTKQEAKGLISPIESAKKLAAAIQNNWNNPEAAQKEIEAAASAPPATEKPAAPEKPSWFGDLAARVSRIVQLNLAMIAEGIQDLTR